MIGRYLERISRALVRPSTFDATIAPAIADLQHESPLGTWARLRAYAGVWRVLGVSVALEVGNDCAATFRGAHVSAAIAPAVLTLLVTFAAMTPWGIWREFGRWRPWHHDVVLMALFLPGILALILPSIALPICARLARVRTAGAMRSAVLLTVAGVSALVFTSGAFAQRTADLQRELIITSIMSVRAGDAHRPIWEARQRFAPRLETMRLPSANAETAARRARMERHGTAALALTVISFALFGAAWSSRGRWTTAVLAAAIFLATGAVRALFYRVLYIQTVFGPLIAMWTLAILFFLVACLVTVRARRTART